MYSFASDKIKRRKHNSFLKTMHIIESVKELTQVVATAKQQGKKIGLVPTMGALHEGHLSLVKKSLDENDITIVSIFVNPTQFNNPVDLERYPRREQEDFKLLAREGVDIAFAPSVEEIYPVDMVDAREFNLGNVAEVMEGKHRPGHFQGVAQIVNKLFLLCRPYRAYFGMKDFQQIIVIKEMVKSEGLDVEIIACPIVRDEDGLALSSRNLLLDEAQRKAAPEIYFTLQKSVEYSHSHSVEETKRKVVDTLNNIPGFRVEYFEIVNGETLVPMDEWSEAPFIVGCITVYVGEIRLIDNIFYRHPDKV